jgi:proteasome accessory factor A
MNLERIVTEDEVEWAIEEPPPTTRAYFRGKCLQRWASSIAAANWDSLVFDLGAEPLRRIPMMEPLRGTAAIVDTLLDGCTSPQQLVDRLDEAQRRQQDPDGRT